MSASSSPITAAMRSADCTRSAPVAPWMFQVAMRSSAARAWSSLSASEAGSSRMGAASGVDSVPAFIGPS
jgi:hypothetical protein